MSRICRVIRYSSAALSVTGWAASIHYLINTEADSAGPRLIMSVALAVTGSILFGVGLAVSSIDAEGAYRLGVTVGRVQTLEAMNRPATVTPLRPAPHGLHDFNAQSATGHRGHP